MNGSVEATTTVGVPGALRRWATDPLVPSLGFGSLALIAAAASWPALTWAMIGGLAGYSLSGSV